MKKSIKKYVNRKPQNHGINRKYDILKSVYYSKIQSTQNEGKQEMLLENEKIKQALEYLKEEDPATTQDTLN